MKKILICGGHPTPALAIIDELKKNHPEISLVFVGRKYAIESERTLSYEYKGCVERNIPFQELQAGRITRLITKSSILNMMRVPYGFLQAFLIILEEKPDCVVSFGGYIALPMAFWAWVFHTPVFTHEQTMKPGSANKFIGFFSRKIFVAFESVLHYFPQQKTEWIGNPVREVVFTKNTLSFPLDTSAPVLYITGGSLGSHSVNQHIFSTLDTLLPLFTIIHQTGDVKEYGDLETAQKLKKHYQKLYPNRYMPMAHINDNDIGTVYEKAEFIIGRSGANTFFELIALQKPALFIPLPWSANGEQRAHAEFFKDHNIGEVFDQKIDNSQLIAEILAFHKKLKQYVNAFNSLPLQLKRDATQTLIQKILHS
ncbi:MAG: UDP-N-acetylglucosamine--N-acetylmuramyl-(pentapeptide) pyrophosphoryl-undecaprenol N-acetylglucosamine transferase [Candidatus Roizmanbacteria bacterium]|nr:UDP-N-acetylglucosamine--N-acetylmuramyl-(pentapeptide) pyrophosphoryl-undecaprenol N-acetylglucosamine transferase [Candidatus Roizmanbacteria bacterium]